MDAGAIQEGPEYDLEPSSNHDNFEAVQIDDVVQDVQQDDDQQMISVDDLMDDHDAAPNPEDTDLNYMKELNSPNQDNLSIKSELDSAYKYDQDCFYKLT